MKDYIVCPLCGKHIQRMKSHLRMAKEHKGLDYKDYLNKHPEIPLLSDNERQRYSKSQQEYCKSDKGKTQMSEMANKLWSDENFRTRRIQEIRDQHQTEEFKILHSEISHKVMLKLNQNPEFSRKASNNLKTYGKRVCHYYNGKLIKFKSKLEYEIAKCLENYNILYEYESKIIPYFIDNERHSYTVDFVLPEFNIMIEGKPESLWNDRIVKLKLESAKNYFNNVYLIGYNLDKLIEIIENQTTIES